MNKNYVGDVPLSEFAALTASQNGVLSCLCTLSLVCLLCSWILSIVFVSCCSFSCYLCLILLSVSIQLALLRVIGICKTHLGSLLLLLKSLLHY